MGKGVKGFLVNDHMVIGSAQETMWHVLLEGIPGLTWVGGVDFRRLAGHVERRALSEGQPDYIIRNGTFFGPINIAVPQIAFFQDNTMTNAPLRAMQLDVATRSTMNVFNSPFLLSKYQEIEGSCNHVIIPAPVDYGLFRPMPPMREKWGIKEGAVCWIGANNQWKGFDLLCEIIRDMPDTPFVVVRKDRGSELDGIPNIKCLFNVSHEDLVEIINCCKAGLCTSKMESQHLGGLEMGACGLPILTTDVGAYWGRYPGPWGMTCSFRHHFTRALEAILARDIPREEVRNYWLSQPFRKDSVLRNWRGVIGAVTGVSLESA